MHGTEETFGYEINKRIWCHSVWFQLYQREGKDLIVIKKIRCINFKIKRAKHIRLWPWKIQYWFVKTQEELQWLYISLSKWRQESLDGLWL